MQFFSLKKIQTAPRNATRPFATLRHDFWDDFGYKTLFDLHFYPESGDSFELGPVKIARTGVMKRTELPDKFTELGEEYFSLGQSMEYYEAIRSLPKAVHRKLLLGLRDIVYNPAIDPSLSSPDVFATSLLRFSQAAKVLQEAGRLFRIDAPEHTDACSFMFTVKLNEAVSAHELAVRLGDNPQIPDRIMALIGKNGTGKTWVLGRLAAALSGDEVGVGMFQPERPGFERVIAVSYSAFDRFNKPTKKRTFSYVYCGIYDSDGKINSRVKLLRKAREAAQTIMVKNRRELWQDLIRNVMDGPSTDAMKEYIFDHTPLSGSWLNMAESIQRVLKRRALDGQHPASPAEVVAWIEAIAGHWNAAPTPFVWGGKRAARRKRERDRRHRVGGSGAETKKPLKHTRKCYGHAHSK